MARRSGDGTNRDSRRIDRADDCAGCGLSHASHDHCRDHGQDSRLCSTVRSSGSVHCHGYVSHMQGSEQTKFCISCHSMENYGKSLYVDNPNYIPAQHFQNHRVPPDMACYACHTDYTIYGPLKDKLKGITRIYLQYVSTPPNPIHISGGYSNLQCLHCHAGARSFEENPIHVAIMDSLKTNQMSCISSGCHDTVHNASEVDHLKMWRPAQ